MSAQMSGGDTDRFVLVKDGGFTDIPHGEGPFLQLSDLGPAAALGAVFLDLEPDDDLADVASHLHRIARIRIAFPNSHDGRGFSLAQRLRRLDFQGIICGRGDLIADQYRLALQSGFDELEIPARRAERQPEHQWQAQLTSRAAYRDRLGLASKPGQHHTSTSQSPP